MTPRKRSYVGELEWALGQIQMAHQDRNPNRAAQIDGMLKYAHEVAVARRSKEPIPCERPDRKKLI